jgi:hypothetical protein
MRYSSTSGGAGYDGGEGGGGIGADGDGDFEARAFEIAESDLGKAADGAVGDGAGAAGGLCHGGYAGALRAVLVLVEIVGRNRIPHCIAIVLGGDLLALPVHAGGLAVVDLHPIHADVALAGARVAGDDAGEGDEAAAVVGPALEDGKVVEVEVVAANDFLAGGVFGADGFGEGAGEFAELREHFELVEEAFGGFEVEQAGDAVGDVVEIINAESQGHAPLAAELVDEDLVAGMALYVFEEERGAAGFGDAVGDLGDFQLRGDLLADALQFAVLFEGFDPVAQIVVGHGCS